jgi:threonine/homoserine/homoserine lactone efflux protein
MALAVSSGTKVGIATGAGIAAGDLIHTSMAIVGLSAIIATSALLFSIVKYAGAAFLIYLGIRAMLDKAPVELNGGAPAIGAGRAFRQAVLTEVLNPKTALFFLAFLPQFVDPNAEHPAVQIAFLGVLFALLGLVTDSIWAIAAGTAGGMLRRSRRFVRTQRYVSGTVYIGLGVLTAFAGGAED